MATYYVDATDGSDSAEGALSDPWKTISKVNGASFSAGDSILFKRGEVWNEQLIPPSSGSEGLPITIGAYGTGSNPLIKSTVQINDYTITNGRNGILNSGFETVGAEPPAALYWSQSTLGSSTITRCTIPGCTPHGGSYALAITYGDTLVNVQNSARYVLPGYNYRFSYWGKSDGQQTLASYLNSGTYYLQDTAEGTSLQTGVPYLKTWTTSANYSIDTTPVFKTAATDTEWTKHTIDLMWHPGGEKAYKGPFFAIGVAGGTAYVDDVEWRPLWTADTTNVWKIHVMGGASYYPRILTKNGVELHKVTSTASLTTEGDWCLAKVSSELVVYLYSTSNPDTTTDVYEIAKYTGTGAVIISSKSYIDIENIDFRGGSFTSPEYGVVNILSSDHINLINVQVYDGFSWGIYNSASSYVSVTRSILRDHREHGLRTTGPCSYVSATYNDVYNIGTHEFDAAGEGGGLGAAISSGDVTFSHNYIHDSGYAVAGTGTYTTDAAITVLGTNNTVSYNRIYNCVPIGITVAGDAAAASGNIYGNDVSYIGNGAELTDYFQIGLYLKNVENLNVYNNTFSYVDPSKSSTTQGATLRLRNPFGAGVVLKNNVFHQKYNASVNAFISWVSNVADGGNATLLMDNNLYYKTDGGGYYRVGNSEASTASLTTYRSNLESNFSSHEDSGMFADPRLSSTLHLLPGSPAINAGVDVGLTSDIEGRSVPQELLPDIGAYEYIKGQHLMTPNPMNTIWQ